MAEKTIPTTSIFATKSTDAKDVRALIAAGLEAADASGEIDWATMPDAARPFNVEGGSLPIGYSRAWLIVTRAWYELNQPKSLVTLPKKSDANEERVAQAKIVVPMRNEEELSWGHIAVRCGVSENHVRKVYRKTPGHKDLGDRIGKGGRFAYDEPEFYLEHRKSEGAHIPNDGSVKGKPPVEKLLNAKGPDGKVVRFKRVPGKGATKAS